MERVFTVEYEKPLHLERFFLGVLWKMYYIYILICGDGSFYTGICTDMKKRLAQHRDGTGAKYTRGRGPLRLAYLDCAENRSLASKEEARIKKLSKIQKKLLIDGCDTQLFLEFQ